MFLGIDLGTTELKVMLLAPDGQIVGTERRSLSVSRPRPRWSEQSPESWWQALDAAMLALRTRHEKGVGQVRAVGVAGQMHGAVVLDSGRQVLRPAILWNDGRSERECQELGERVPHLADISGTLAMPGFTAPKLMWLRTHEPECFARIACVMLPKDYLRLRMTGEAVTECSDASGTLWLDVGQRRWSETLIAASGMEIGQLPRLAEGSDAVGVLDGTLGRRWGFPEHVVVAAGAADNAAAAIGVGAIQPGQGFVSLGTSGVVFQVSEGFRPNASQATHAYCHALRGRWYSMAVMLSAASCLAWVTKMTGFADEAAAVAAATALGVEARAHAPLFLPYLSGERTPHNDPTASGVWFGLTHAHGPAELVWSVMEGVAFGLADGLAAINSSASRTPLALVGGGARSERWAQMIASVLETPMQVAQGSEAGAALGAARLAALAHGVEEGELFGARSDARARVFDPDPVERERLVIRLARFRALYGSLRERFAESAGH